MPAPPLKASIRSGCENGDKTALNVDTATVTYDMCSSAVRNEWGQLLDEATLDVTETGE